ncbi:hypothetical protein H4R33_006090 [Dimargaris cristalligena]|uniref:U1-type domain-containing protein n=1 Tax=Dimargaris cristalligena TaxID=215637 RepID=A0A4P9ZPE8_9FUNG|nr:hypothetical protein H4R33_006090 [Dimargaris cristalligena]RKP35316.1 hypothetical protein BJ085DRAFT_35590 [Dimargaris cristalligena]|eukprot:RKP35316.1 hypothetical protein BJ085DRAFT_35590 [Dimargaris cristalligena]
MQLPTFTLMAVAGMALLVVPDCQAVTTPEDYWTSSYNSSPHFADSSTEASGPKQLVAATIKGRPLYICPYCSVLTAARDYQNHVDGCIHKKRGAGFTKEYIDLLKESQAES